MPKNKRLFFFIFFIFTCNLAADEDENFLHEKVLFISLGSHCQTAAQLDHYVLRKIAFPFDWLMTNCNESIIKCLYEDFYNFWNKNVVSSNPKWPNHFNNSYYKIGFWHEWLFNDFTYTEERENIIFEETYKKYERRINRFRNLRNYTGKVFFIRTASSISNLFPWLSECKTYISLKEAIDLRDAIKYYFPNLNFTLAIVNYTSRNSKKFKKFENIVEYSTRDESTFDFESFKATIEALKSLANGNS